MTREEAIKILNRDDDEMRKGYFCINDFLAIEVLKSGEPCEDCVSRKRLMDNYNGVETPVGYRKVVDLEVIKNMSSVTPTRKKGHWIESNYEHMNGHRIRQWYCSECGGIHHDKETGEWREVFDFRYAYCPLCGAEMENKA